MAGYQVLNSTLKANCIYLFGCKFCDKLNVANRNKPDRELISTLH